VGDKLQYFRSYYVVQGFNSFGGHDCLDMSWSWRGGGEKKIKSYDPGKYWSHYGCRTPEN